MTIRLAILGAGTIGQVHAKAADAAGLSVALVADTELSRAQSLAAQFPNAAATADFSQLLADASLDAVVVSVPNRWHSECAIAAMQAGLDVLVEKPMGVNECECRAMNDVAESTGRILQIGMANRWSAVGRSAKRVVESQQLGSITHAKAILYRRRGVPGLGGWFTTKAVSGGGVLVDNGVHLIDLLLWLLDFPRVSSVAGQVYSQFGVRMGDYVYDAMWAGPPRLDGICDVEDSAHAFVRLANGATLDIQTSWAMNIPTKMESSLVGLFGDQAGLTFELYGDHLDLATERERKNVDIRLEVEPTDAFMAQMTDFADCIATRRQPMANGRQGRLVQSVLDAIYQSSETGREVRP